MELKELPMYESRIARVSCDRVSFPVELDLKGDSVEVSALLVSVESQDGAKGAGFIVENDMYGGAVISLVENDLASLLVGEETASPEYLWKLMVQRRSYLDFKYPSGLAARAVSGIDQALWDLRGRLAGMPIHQMLGSTDASIEVYMTFGLSLYAKDEELEAAQRLVDDGHKHFKLQAAVRDEGNDIRHDIARIQAAREIIGENATLIIDGQTRYNPYQAIRLGQVAAEAGLTIFDEPIWGNDIQGLSRLKAACPQLSLAARTRGSLLDHRDLASSGVVEVMGQSVLDQGGFTGSMKFAHISEAFQLPVATGGGWPWPNAHLISAIDTGWMTEYHTLYAGFLEKVLVDPIRPSAGRLELPKGPGLGFELDAAAVSEGISRAQKHRQ